MKITIYKKCSFITQLVSQHLDNKTRLHYRGRFSSTPIQILNIFPACSCSPSPPSDQMAKSGTDHPHRAWLCCFIYDPVTEHSSTEAISRTVYITNFTMTLLLKTKGKSSKVKIQTFAKHSMFLSIFYISAEITT